MGDKESNQDNPHHPHHHHQKQQQPGSKQPQFLCSRTEKQKSNRRAESEADQEDETGNDSDHAEGVAGPRRQSVTFTSSTNEPCLDRRKLQRTPTPFHEILLAEAEKSPDSAASDADAPGQGQGQVAFEVGGESPAAVAAAAAAAATTAIRPSPIRKV